MMAQT